MAIAAVRLLSVPVTDPAKAREFYVSVLGLTLVRDDHSMPGMNWVSVLPRGGGPALSLVNWFAQMPAGSLRGLVLSCDDIDAEVAHLRAAGVTIVQEPTAQSWATEAVIADPDGNELILQQAER
jgi:predicted enzyme related to lactoylglutathione lyase